MRKLPRFSVTAALLRRVFAHLAALAVGGVAARATWEHIVHVGRKYGEEMAVWLPVSIDGMMIAGVLLQADARATGKGRNWWATFCTWVGGALSVAAQLESGRERGAVAAGIAMVPSVTLILVVEALAWSGKLKQLRERTAAGPVEEAQAIVSAQVAQLPVPVSPAIFSAPEMAVEPPSGQREPYGPRDGQQYSERHGRRLRNGR
jgi:hypothetical protein